MTRGNTAIEHAFNNWSSLIKSNVKNNHLMFKVINKRGHAIFILKSSHPFQKKVRLVSIIC